MGLWWLLRVSRNEPMRGPFVLVVRPRQGGLVPYRVRRTQSGQSLPLDGTRAEAEVVVDAPCVCLWSFAVPVDTEQTTIGVKGCCRFELSRCGDS